MDLRRNSTCLNRMFQSKHQKLAFPKELKNADISHVHKKKDCHDKANYGSVSTLPLL